MSSFIVSIDFREFLYIGLNSNRSYLFCGKHQGISTWKSPLNSYGNPQSTLARLPFSDGSKRLLAEWWQIKCKTKTLFVSFVAFCLGASDVNHAEGPLNLSLEQVRHNIRDNY